MRIRIATVGLLVAALTLGCAQQPPAASPTSSKFPTSADEPLLATNASPTKLDPSLLGSLVTGVKDATDYDRHLAANWPLFNRQPIDDQVGAYFSSLVEAFRRDHPEVQPKEQKPTAEFNLGWAVIGSSTELVGLVSEGSSRAGSVTTATWRSFWFRPATGAVLAPAELAQAEATNHALRRAASTDGLKLPADPFAEARLVGFSPAGGLIVGYDACQVAACDSGLVSLTLPASETDSLLTPAGELARRATLSPAEASTPSPTPSPTASPSPTPPPRPDCRRKKCVAITFDDGPGPDTRRLLKYLAKANAPATFFMLGSMMEANPQIVKEVAAANHEIGVHAWNHPYLPGLSSAQVKSQINRTADFIEKLTGTRPTLLRTPYGATSDRVSALAKKAGMPLINWNVDPEDWKYKNSAKVTQGVFYFTHRNSIVLLHDIHPTTVSAVPGILSGLKKRGFTFVTVSDLLGNPKPGVLYRSGSAKKKK